MKWTIGRKIGAGYAVALLALVLIGVVAYRNTTELIADAGWVAHNHEAL